MKSMTDLLRDLRAADPSSRVAIHLPMSTGILARREQRSKLANYCLTSDLDLTRYQSNGSLFAKIVGPAGKLVPLISRLEELERNGLG